MPDYPILTMPDGQRFEVLSFHRKAEPGETYVADQGRIAEHDGRSATVYRYPILRRLPESPLVAEVKRAIARLNSNGGLERNWDAVKILSAAVATFDPPKPERFYIDPAINGRAVFDRETDRCVGCGSTENEAECFAAALNNLVTNKGGADG